MYHENVDIFMLYIETIKILQLFNEFYKNIL